MSELPYMQFFPADYIRDTRVLSLSAQGAWMTLLCSMWHPASRGMLDMRLSAYGRIIGTTEERTRALIEEIHESGVADVQWSDDKVRAKIRCRRIVRDWKQAEDRQKSLTESGKRGAVSKWGSVDPNKVKRSERLAAARQKGRHTQEQWEWLVRCCETKCVRCGADGGELVKDHILPIYMGGSDGVENLQPLCRTCNSSKGPEVKDFRPDAWQNAWPMPGQCLAIQKPEARSQKEEREPKGELPSFSPPLGSEDWKNELRSSEPFCDSWREWRQHLGELGKTLTRGTETAVLMECARNGPGRSVEVIRFSISKGAKNLIWDDAPRISTKKSSGNTDPEGWPEWREKNYPDADKSVPYHQVSRDIQQEFENAKKDRKI